MSTSKRPNFLVVIADDLGFSDTSPYGSEIRTPNLDKLIEMGGIRLTNFHTASACSPTRSMLLSGTDNHLAGLGQMAETISRSGDTYQGKLGYEGVLNDKVAALPEILADEGYFCALSGKWHLGLTKDSIPAARGFHKSFSLLPGAGNHYAYEPQLSAPETPAIKFMPPLYYQDEKRLELEDLPKPFYSSEAFATKMIEYLRDHHEQNPDQPFFAYLAFTAPHWPLQADAEIVAKYEGVYDSGPAQLRKQRLESLQRLNLIRSNVTPHPITSFYDEADFKEWDDMSPNEQAYSSKLMATYAAMVESMDTHIGRVLDYLTETEQLENTFVLFMSDNGAEGALLEALPVMGPSIAKVIAEHYDNSYDNIGRANSFTWYGPAWAQAATAPSRMYKAWITEGGIRCPCIVRYPSLQPSSASSNIVHEFATVMDILPTILDLARVSHPGDTFRGRKVLTPRGRSWIPYLTGHATRIHDEDHITGWELFGQQAIRQGRFKAIYIPAPVGPDRWQLYDIEEDPAELHDLAEQRPDVLEKLIDHWITYVAETGTILVPLEDRKKAGVGYGPR